MLEWASTCLETGRRQLCRTPKRCLRSRRMLHSAFWHHGASDLSLPVWWAYPPSPDPIHGDDGDGGGSKYSLPVGRGHNGLLLEFLYPEQTLALLQRISTYGWDSIETRRKHQLNGSSIRQFSTTCKRMVEVNLNGSDAQKGTTEEEMHLRLATMSPDEALQELLQPTEEGREKEGGKQELAWRLYSAIPEWKRTTDLKLLLLTYLASPNVPVDPNHILHVFNQIPTEHREASSYRIAISAYLTLEMIGPAVQLHEEAAPRFPTLDYGAYLLLWRTVYDDQWDLTLRVFKSYLHSEIPDIPALRVDVGFFGDLGKTMWGMAVEVPNLSDKLQHLLQHVQQFRHQIRATEEDEKVLRILINGFVPIVMEQILTAEDPDESLIWDFFVNLFERLQSLEIPTLPLYEHAILRMLEMPRYRNYSNERKIFLELYEMLKREAFRDESRTLRPSLKLLKALLRQHGSYNSTYGVHNMVMDFKSFYPRYKPNASIWKYLIVFYAKQADVERVHQYFDELRTSSDLRGGITVREVSSLLYVYARRADTVGTEEQFRRISEEFNLTPNLTCWNILLLSYTRADDLDGALACFNRILDSGVVPDIVTFGPMLDLCAARGDVEAFQALYSRAEQFNIPIRSHEETRSGYVLALLNSQDVEGAEAVALSMLRDHRMGRLRGSLTDTWNKLITHYALNKDVAGARRIYRQMIEYKIPIDSWTYAALMRSLIEVGVTNSAYKILRTTMPNNNVQVHAFHYAIVISGYLNENQYARALKVHQRMIDRKVPQTASSRLASLHAIGMSELRELRNKNIKREDKRRRLLAVEEYLRQILIEGYETDKAHDQPRHTFGYEPIRQSGSDGYFGFLIHLYSTQGSYRVCKELFEAATIARPHSPDIDIPVGLLTAMMEAHYRAKEYGEIQKCWELARTQADNLIRTYQQSTGPQFPATEFDSLVDPSVCQQATKTKVANQRRKIIVRATRVYIRSLIRQMEEDPNKLQEAQRTIRNLITSGYVIDNLTWNEFIQALARRGRIVDAFTTCEAYLMPQFPGWRELNPYYIRKNKPGFVHMEIRRDPAAKEKLVPRYKTLVVLASVYARIRRDEANGMGFSSDLGGWVRDVLDQMAPLTVRAIETMPKLGDGLQRKLLGEFL